MKHCRMTPVLLVVVIVCAAVLAGCSIDQKLDKTAEKIAKNSFTVGDTIETTAKSDVDKKNHKISYKITKVVDDTKATADYVKKYNLSAADSTLEESPGKDMMYVVVGYHVSYPSDFPVKEYGIRNPQLKFSVTDPSGKDVIHYKGTEYTGISETHEIGTLPTGYDFYPGKTYKGKFIFIVPKGCKEYLVKEKSHYIDFRK